MARKPAQASAYLREAHDSITAAVRAARAEFGDRLPESALNHLLVAAAQVRAATRELDRHAAVHGAGDKIDQAWGFQ